MSDMTKILITTVISGVVIALLVDQFALSPLVALLLIMAAFFTESWFWAPPETGLRGRPSKRDS